MPYLLDHVSIAVTDFDRAATFYEAIFGALGVEPLRRSDERMRFGEPGEPGVTFLSIVKSDDARPGGPNRHWAFRATSTEQVDAFHAAGLAAGGSDNGAPGPRPDYHERYYGAFLLDPDGNHVEAVCHEA